MTPNVEPRLYVAAADELAGRVIAITGAGSGIGRAVALACAAHGAEVVLLGRTVHKLERVYDEIRAAGSPEPIIAPLDLERATAREYDAVADAIGARFGRLDGLLHNAGLLGDLSPIEHYDVPLWTRVLHVNVTSAPSAAWTAQQIVEAVGPDFEAKRLIRDRDGIYGAAFDKRVRSLGIEQLRTAPRSPWQNGYAERWVGTLRRELLDHVIPLGERHLLRLVRQHAVYYNDDRPHMALAGDAPAHRPVEPPERGEVVALPRVGGLHHRYSRAA